MTFYYIIAENYGDFRDYLDRMEIPESEAKHISVDSSLEAAPCKLMNQHHIHITKFAKDNDDMRIKFFDLQIALSRKTNNVKTVIETEEGVVACANVSFLKL